MKHLISFVFRKRKAPSLLAYGVVWFTRAPWVERLIATGNITHYQKGIR